MNSSIAFVRYISIRNYVFYFEKCYIHEEIEPTKCVRNTKIDFSQNGTKETYGILAEQDSIFNYTWSRPKRNYSIIIVLRNYRKTSTDIPLLVLQTIRLFYFFYFLFFSYNNVHFKIKPTTPGDQSLRRNDFEAGRRPPENRNRSVFSDNDHGRKKKKTPRKNMR